MYLQWSWKTNIKWYLEKHPGTKNLPHNPEEKFIQILQVKDPGHPHPRGNVTRNDTFWLFGRQKV